MKIARVLRRVVAKPAEDYGPSLAEIYKAGRSMGLDQKDIAQIYKASRPKGIKGFVSRHWWFFLIAAVISIGIFFVVFASAPSGNTGGGTSTGSPFGNYPSGARYGTIGIKDFKKNVTH